MSKVYILSSNTKKYSKNIQDIAKKGFEHITSIFSTTLEHKKENKNSEYKEMNLYFILPLLEEDRARLLNNQYTDEEFIIEYERLKATENQRLNNKIEIEKSAYDIIELIRQDPLYECQKPSLTRRLNDAAAEFSEGQITEYDLYSYLKTIKFISNFLETNHPISTINTFFNNTDAPYSVSGPREISLNKIVKVPVYDTDFCHTFSD